MREISPDRFPEYRKAALACCDCVYPLSVAEGVQAGRIFTLGESVLFRHFCGFAFLAGTPDTAALCELRERILHADTRFLLITDDSAVTAFFADDPAFEISQRVYYSGVCEISPPALPQGFTLRAIDAEWLPRLRGRIVPAFSWDSPARFLQNGFGYCITQGDQAAAWAFTAAVTSLHCDIGVETLPEFRGMGLAKCAAYAVLQEAQSPRDCIRREMPAGAPRPAIISQNDLSA
jgi:hypothetical protein